VIITINISSYLTIYFHVTKVIEAVTEMGYIHVQLWNFYGQFTFATCKIFFTNVKVLTVAVILTISNSVLHVVYSQSLLTSADNIACCL